MRYVDQQLFELDARCRHHERQRDKIMTAQAYTLIMMPACASVRENVAAISVSRPIGINSDVFGNTNAENVMPKSGSHCRRRDSPLHHTSPNCTDGPHPKQAAFYSSGRIIRILAAGQKPFSNFEESLTHFCLIKRAP